MKRGVVLAIGLLLGGCGSNPTSPTGIDPTPTLILTVDEEAIQIEAEGLRENQTIRIEIAWTDDSTCWEGFGRGEWWFGAPEWEWIMDQWEVRKTIWMGWRNPGQTGSGKVGVMVFEEKGEIREVIGEIDGERVRVEVREGTVKGGAEIERTTRGGGR